MVFGSITSTKCARQAEGRMSSPLPGSLSVGVISFLGFVFRRDNSFWDVNSLRLSPPTKYRLPGPDDVTKVLIPGMDCNGEAAAIKDIL